MFTLNRLIIVIQTNVSIFSTSRRYLAICGSDSLFNISSAAKNRCLSKKRCCIVEMTSSLDCICFSLIGNSGSQDGHRCPLSDITNVTLRVSSISTLASSLLSKLFSKIISLLTLISDWIYAWRQYSKFNRKLALN